MLRGMLHALAALAALPATAMLVSRARSGSATVMALTYGLSLVLVFGVSGLYHTPMWSLAARRRMRRLDHSTIYLLIAGSYAPFAATLDPLPRGVVFSITICGAVVGLFKAHAWEHAPRLLTTGFYVVIGWCIAPFLPQLYERIGAQPLALLLLGGILYSAGAAVYGTRFPNPWPRVFGYHEVNHLLGVSGAVMHYIAIWMLLT
jgi:hemolysin III